MAEGEEIQKNQKREKRDMTERKKNDGTLKRKKK